MPGASKARGRNPCRPRIGGFGGVAGLVDFITVNNITHVVDATHPFAAQMSRHAVLAAQQAGGRLVALTRPAWRPVPGDRWTRVPDIPAAVAALEGPAQRIFLAHRPAASRCLCGATRSIITCCVWSIRRKPRRPCRVMRSSSRAGRSPSPGDTALMREHGITLVVAKNAGGKGASAKLAAARALGLPVLMIDRPPAPERREARQPARGARLAGSCGHRARGIDKGGTCRSMMRVALEPTITTVRMSAISGVACGPAAPTRIVSSGSETSRAKITGRLSPQASFRIVQRFREPLGAARPTGGCRTPSRNRPRTASRRRFSSTAQGFRLSLRLIAQKSCPSGAPARAAAASIAVMPGSTRISSSRQSCGPASSASNTAEAIAKTPGSPDETTTTRRPAAAIDSA